MTPKAKRFALMTAMTMMMAQSNSSPYTEYVEHTDRKDTSHLRKKCKSCKLFPCHNDKHKWRPNPMAQACEMYEKKK